MSEASEQPLNREPAVEDLIKNFLTPADEGYDRNHSLQPGGLDASAHRVVVDGEVNTKLSLSIDELKHGFTQHTVVCALQCAGNRRHTMRTKIKEVSGVDWQDGAIFNARWHGPLLVDVLERAGVRLDDEQQRYAHVAFACYEAECQDDTWYGGSIPLERALQRDAEVVLALDMNDKPLTPRHGYPVRIVTPGVAGARSVKWLNQITVQMKESENHYQNYDYKFLPPEVDTAEKAQKHWDTTPAIQDMPVNSVVAIPQNGSTVKCDSDGTVETAGYALPSGDGGPVTKVEVSGDDGRSWTQAEIIQHPDSGKWTWQLWQARVHISPGKNRVVYSKATDAAGNTQSDKLSQWTYRGVCYNGWGMAEELTVE